MDREEIVEVVRRALSGCATSRGWRLREERDPLAVAVVTRLEEAGLLPTGPAHRAADLSEGSVVATDKVAWIKESQFLDVPWTSSQRGNLVGNRVVDEALARGARVLRVGTGREG
jgi:hypothetical protein